ncbi:hypothetical protein PHMEG_0002658 [Phytophthora megakarya]|uniref:Bromo domain-containing protein n=1 Tax=Phytophthora megakarya TaxID=4795 RepID=A0A225X016_9STRA|nr:hypothetical protein PHMEG_0002658 [Phytophthora megakarya]
MYHGAARDRGDKKRQRLTPPPNEVWMEAIMSKGKTPDGYIPASAVATGAVATSSAAAWQGRARAPPDWEATPQASMAQGSMQQQQYSTSGYQGRTVERSTSYQGRKNDGYQGRSMNANYQGRMDGSYQGRSMEAATGYPGRASASNDPARAANGAPAYQGRTGPSSAAYQGRTDTAATYQGRMTDNAAYQGRMTDSSAAYQGRMTDNSAAYQGSRAMDGAMGYQARAMAAATGYAGQAPDGAGPYQGRSAQSSASFQGRPMDGSGSGGVESMLREQVNLDEAVLQDAFSVAMEDLIPERAANFLAKGLCHLCGGLSDNHFVPVVNFCPHAEENHSLCREHLRSVYRVRMEALFVGRNGSAPNRRLLRCLVCTSGCPCTGCTTTKVKEVQKYKRYLLETLRRSGQGAVPAAKGDHAAEIVAATPLAEGRPPYGNTQSISAQSISGNDDPRYQQYPTSPAEGRPPVQPERFTIRNKEAENPYEGGGQMQPQQSEYGQYPADERNNRDGHSLSMQSQSKTPAQYQADGRTNHSLSMQAQSKSPTQQPVPKRAAKDTPIENAQAANPHVARAADPRVAMTASPQVHPGSVDSPSAVTVMNCAESEKSLVQALRSLNQGVSPPSSTAMNISNPSTNGIAPRIENSSSAPGSDAQDSDDTEGSPRIYIRDRRRPADDSPYQDQSSVGSGRSSFGGLSVEENQTRKRKASGSDAEDIPPPRNSGGLSLSRDDSRVAAAARNESSIKERNAEDKRHHQSGASSMLKAKPDVHGKHILPKADIKEKHSAPNMPPPPPPHRGPGRPRKVHPDSATSKKTPPELKQDEEETEDEVYREEEDDQDENEDDGSESELDTNLDFCECLHMTENDLPEGDWQCDECKKPSRFDGYSTAVAAEHGLLDRCLKIVECLKSHPFSKPFLTPVENVPMYTRVVKQPMDLSRIEIKLKKGAYIVDSNTVASGVKELDHTHFANDIRLMWSNCKLFNDDGSGITRAADILSAGFERLYKESIAPPLTS